MKIRIHQVLEEGTHYDGEDPGSIMEVRDPEWNFDGPVFYSLDATRLPDALLIKGRVWTTAAVCCSRCLSEFPYDLEVADFVVHHTVTSEDIVDLTPEIRENILLEMPQKPLCRDDCKGLCPVCGCDRNKQTCRCVQPPSELRWAGLGKLEL